MDRLVFILLLILVLFWSINKFSLQSTDEFKYVADNIENVDKFVVETDTLLGKHCYLLDTTEGFNALKSVKIKKKVDTLTTDSDTYYKIYFNDGEVKLFKFEGENFVYNDNKYSLKQNLHISIDGKTYDDKTYYVYAKKEIECE